MNDKTMIGVHWSFWLISSIALIWNAMGSINFFMQMSPGMLEMYRESERLIIQGRPAWATIGFAVAVLGGTLGSLLILLRKSVARYVFIASLIGVIVTMAHTLGGGIEFGIGEIIGIIMMPVLVAAFLIWYSFLVKSKHWIN